MSNDSTLANPSFNVIYLTESIFMHHTSIPGTEELQLSKLKTILNSRQLLQGMISIGVV